VRSPLGHWARDEATGYRVDMRRLSCVSDELRDAMRTVEHTPILSAKFETSVPGLYVSVRLPPTRSARRCRLHSAPGRARPA
jgi:hypothetical protein